MRIIEVREHAVPLSRFAPDLRIGSGGLDTSVVTVVSDVRRAGRPVLGHGFGSIGRYSCGGLIRDRFAPRLLAADLDPLDPVTAWPVLMAGEKPGGHGERCVAVGTLDMALWDLAARLADEPLHALLARRFGRPEPITAGIPVYAAGGYRYPHADAATDRRLLADEVAHYRELGHTHVKIKIADGPLADDLARIDAVLDVLGDAGRLAVDAMNRYPADRLDPVADALAGYGLWWWEDVCDPLDFAAQAAVCARYPGPVAAGEALFSLPDARNLLRYGGLRPALDRLVFDPVHCYGLTEYVRIIEAFEAAGWPRTSFWPHGGHPFSLHVAAGLGLGGAEVNPLGFAPFGGLPPGVTVDGGIATLPQAPGIGLPDPDGDHGGTVVLDQVVLDQRA